MAATLINLTGFQFGILADETGINIASISRKWMATKLEVPDKGGDARGLVFHNQKLEVDLKGEKAGTTGVMAAAVAVALTLANTLFGHGLTTGGLYVDEITEDEGREKLREISVKGTIYPGIT